ncbi:MAG TPA: carboxypeptidase-like regulatory domain-containing protein [Pyrinomonadaceae bacterium]|nr:carboxypeptidase-like regulatory domain-containing protein [Pyrinomonadaceae bacterium]
MPTLLFLCFLFGLTGTVSANAPGNPCGGIGGAIRSQDLTIPQRGGGTLNAKAFAPDANLQTAPCPAISMLPGGGAEISSVEWAAQRLAANGYVVIITKPQLGGSLDSYNTAVRSGIDFLLSAANPYLSGTDTDAIGAAGWSFGARILARTQEEDTRISVIVGWDNLAVSEVGDLSSPQCTNQPTILRTPRVPALSQASDTCNDGRSADAKKTPFNRWRQFGQPAMQVVFRGATHFWWSAAATDAQHDLTHYYTQNWFDRWLKGDLTATAKLVSRTVNNVSLDSLLSSIFRSGVAFDGYNCEDLRLGCQASAQTATIAGRVTDAQGRGISRARIILTGDNFAFPVYVTTNPFGYFRFVNVPVNWNYRARVSVKNRSFPAATVSLIPTNDVANLNFVSSP